MNLFQSLRGDDPHAPASDIAEPAVETAESPSAHEENPKRNFRAALHLRTLGEARYKKKQFHYET